MDLFFGGKKTSWPIQFVQLVVLADDFVRALFFADFRVWELLIYREVCVAFSHSDTDCDSASKDANSAPTTREFAMTHPTSTGTPNPKAYVVCYTPLA